MHVLPTNKVTPSRLQESEVQILSVFRDPALLTLTTDHLPDLSPHKIKSVCLLGSLWGAPVDKGLPGPVVGSLADSGLLGSLVGLANNGGRASPEAGLLSVPSLPSGLLICMLGSLG